MSILSSIHKYLVSNKCLITILFLLLSIFFINLNYKFKAIWAAGDTKELTFRLTGGNSMNPQPFATLLAPRKISAEDWELYREKRDELSLPTLNYTIFITDIVWALFFCCFIYCIAFKSDSALTRSGIYLMSILFIAYSLDTVENITYMDLLKSLDSTVSFIAFGKLLFYGIAILLSISFMVKYFLIRK